ncbi:MAG: precorrin-3B C(17)-methyltransferase [Crenarchaeota archaeon]|nr:MAG: precorrin-3B C(17)-methyltransferase [Thermoproteota archaeon]RDJ33388.1 MAG: precorrin-3B C(17)-methyltransferase [Thermoproteota archaeon]RDJ36107.1 MAG: precorrin-3B C(17)-methyltransferase [Thermoproteota archaeon]RDJ38740.1 MAG: precorrin-3B C(17)-methyltransferase [Thermoproteota archaeon]
MEKISIIAITKNGIKTSLKLKETFPNWEAYAPSKFSDNNPKINWFLESTTEKIEKLFKNNEAIICLFSLGAVIRLISPHLKDKKTDPAVIVIDDQSNFVISALSGHIGGANKLTEDIARKIGATPVITTAADVNKTIAVDLVGKEFGWIIDNDSNVTKISAFMVNEEKIGLYQDAGERDWWKKELPKNIVVCSSLEELEKSNAKAFLIISDKKIKKELLEKSVVYRPKTLVVGVGLHWDTSKETIREGLEFCLEKFNLSKKSITKFTSIKKKEDVQGLIEIANEMNVSLVYVPKEELADITIPNPSYVVNTFEGTPSVSEASAIKVSGGKLVVEKQKFPPNLTIAIARIEK